MKRFLIKPNKEHPEHYEVWIVNPWWNLFAHDLPMIADIGSIVHCFNCIHRYVKDHYIYDYKVKVRRY